MMEKIRNNIFKNFIKIICIALMVMCWQTYFVNAKSKVSLSYTSLELKQGSSKKLKVLNIPSGAKVKWKTTNKFAATVTKKGKVKAVRAGKATIKAVYKGSTYTCEVTIPDSNRKIWINAYSTTLAEGETFQLVATATRPLTYHSANEDIAMVNEKGLITAMNPGTVKITIKSDSGWTTCTVTVKSSDIQVPTKREITNKKAVMVRRLTKRNNIVYENITWAKNKDITFKIDNLNESAIKKCVWSSSDESIVSLPSQRSDSKIIAKAKTLKEGTAVVSATVTDANGKEKTYSSNVYVSAPAVNTKDITLYGAGVGAERQQYITFSGLSQYSKVTWSNSNKNAISFTQYKTKIAIKGLTVGSGTLTASVDGKTYKINYNVKNPVFGKITSVLAKGKTTKIVISGIDGVVPIYSSRNKNIATVQTDGTIKGIGSGVTYVDVKLGKYTYSYRVEVAAKGMKTIINRATYIVNHWKYSQVKRMKKGYYDCSALVWKGYKAYKKYQKKLGSKKYAYPAGELFDYLYNKGQIIYLGYLGTDNMKPGDLIFYGDYSNAVKYSTPGRTLDIYHVSMYAGNGMVVEKGGQTIRYNNIKHIVGIGRVVN